jgi:hypothetical protein
MTAMPFGPRDTRVGARADVVVVAPLLEGRDLEAADEELERVRDVRHVDPEVAGALAVDLDVTSGLPTMRFESTSTAPLLAFSARGSFFV